MRALVAFFRNADMDVDGEVFMYYIFLYDFFNLNLEDEAV